MSIKSFNDKIADILANSLSTVWCFYVIFFLVVSVLRFQCPKTILDWVIYIVQTFFQGIALPVLAFVTKKQGDIQTKLMQETHDIVMKKMITIEKHTYHLVSQSTGNKDEFNNTVVITGV